MLQRKVPEVLVKPFASIALPIFVSLKMFFTNLIAFIRATKINKEKVALKGFPVM